MEKNKKHLKYLFCLLTILTYNNCVSDFDYNIRSTGQIPVVNALLFSDSVFQVDLSMSNRPDSNYFEPVTGAEVRAYCNGISLMPSSQPKIDGIYRFDHKIKPENTYSIEISIEGKKNIEASTKIPQSPIINCEKNKYENYHELYSLTIDSVGSDINALYIFLFNKGNGGKWEQASLYCNSPFTDVFNRYFDPMAPEGFSFLYDYFIRIPAKNIVGTKSVIDVIPFGSGPSKLFVVSATREYDTYFKAAYLQRSFDPETDTPFGYYAIPLPGNVTGGAGVFAGANILLFEYENEQ